MINRYIKLKESVNNYWPVVAYRYVSQKQEGVNYIFTPRELRQAFEAEGFKSRDDLWGRVIHNFFHSSEENNIPYSRFVEAIDEEFDNSEEYYNEEELKDIYSLPKCVLTNDGLAAAELKIEEIDDYLDEKPLAEQLGLAKEGTAPAADRIVNLDHNSPPYQEAISALDEVIEAVKNERKNDFEEKERVQKELQAGKILLEADSVDPEKIKATLIKTLKWLGKKFAEKAIDNLAAIAIAAIFTLIGIST